ncbi:hypothetical protein LWI28_022983 [Acer negundo]|uniref:Uncharacterized protein n=1 Tax=Acer negundo TaxID=4023 RepID=A0AAD5IFQ2_ACENE|nr:hypothetical protein LWI28_022983 [Acer negundo]
MLAEQMAREEEIPQYRQPAWEHDEEKEFNPSLLYDETCLSEEVFADIDLPPIFDEEVVDEGVEVPTKLPFTDEETQNSKGATVEQWASIVIRHLSEVIKKIEQELEEAKSAAKEKQLLFEECVNTMSMLEKTIREHDNNRERRLKDFEKKIKAVKVKMRSGSKDLKVCFDIAQLITRLPKLYFFRFVQ